MTFEDLLAAGYKEHPVSAIRYAQRFCQKKVKLGENVLYFINFYEYTKHCSPVAFEIEVVFYTGALDADAWFTVEIHNCQNMAIEEVENFLDLIYWRMGCIPDPHNQDD